jgi:hypothetical protein
MSAIHNIVVAYRQTQELSSFRQWKLRNIGPNGRLTNEAVLELAEGLAMVAIEDITRDPEKGRAYWRAFVAALVNRN